MHAKLLIIIEQQQQCLTKHSLEVIALAQQNKAAQIHVACAGYTLDSIEAELQQFAIDQIHRIEHKTLQTYSSDGFCLAYAALIKQLQPDWVLFPHSYQVRDFAPVLAARFQRSLIADCIGMQTSEQGYQFTRPLFQARCHANITVETGAPVFVSMQAGSYHADAITRIDNKVDTSMFPIEIADKDIRCLTEPAFRSASTDVDLTKAEIILAVGRGIKSADNLEMMHTLATLLGAELAASRPICDEAWLPIARQVGSSGQTVAPKVYIAIGISGAIQHVVGMKTAATIVAVNNDAEAPIFKVADIGIVADLFQFVPALIKVLEERRQ